jgi:hypothetical protein
VATSRGNLKDHLAKSSNLQDSFYPHNVRGPSPLVAVVPWPLVNSGHCEAGQLDPTSWPPVITVGYIKGSKYRLPVITVGYIKGCNIQAPSDNSRLHQRM